MNHSLRLYSNPFKQSLYLLGSLAFVAAGFLLLRDPKFRADPVNVVMAYIDIGFFGLGVLVFLLSMSREVLLRRPVLQVDSQGWTFNPALGQRPQQAAWQDIGRVTMYRQRLQRNKMFYLVVEARTPEDAPDSTVHKITTRFYPSLALALLAVPLNTVFMRTTPAKTARLLQRIRTTFADELRDYYILVDDTIQDM
jgi:hypothetical protein